MDALEIGLKVIASNGDLYTINEIREEKIVSLEINTAPGIIHEVVDGIIIGATPSFMKKFVYIAEILYKRY